MDAEDKPWIIMGVLFLSSIILIIISAIQEYQVMGVWIASICCFVMVFFVLIFSNTESDTLVYSDSDILL